VLAEGGLHPLAASHFRSARQHVAHALDHSFDEDDVREAIREVEQARADMIE
jgi:hypothetical protein